MRFVKKKKINNTLTRKQDGYEGDYVIAFDDDDDDNENDILTRNSREGAS